MSEIYSETENNIQSINQSEVVEVTLESICMSVLHLCSLITSRGQLFALSLVKDTIEKLFCKICMHVVCLYFDFPYMIFLVHVDVNVLVMIDVPEILREKTSKGSKLQNMESRERGESTF